VIEDNLRRCSIKEQEGIDDFVASQHKGVEEEHSETNVNVSNNSIGKTLRVSTLSILAGYIKRGVSELIELTECKGSLSQITLKTMDGCLGAISVRAVCG